MIEGLELPIVLAPLAGGPATPELAAAVTNAGGLGFVAAGYKSVEALAAEIARTRELTSGPFGVNVFARPGGPADRAVVERYADELREEARRAGVRLGPARFDDDSFDAKFELLCGEPPAIVSFTFGCPSAVSIGKLRSSGASVWITVTDPTEALQAVEAGADGLVVQGLEAGGHRGSFSDPSGSEQFGLLALLQLVGSRVDVPLVATGGISTGRAVAAALTAGAAAAQVGTAFLRCPEAGTSAPHRAVLGSPARTELTRAFTGRLARGIVNRLQAEHSAHAPAAYPELHHLTAPLRAYGRSVGDPELINLWAGQAHELAEELPAAAIVTQLVGDARAALEEVGHRLRG